jgi:23S rRNA pseudouridine1911/1915/1917 synthase
LLILNKPANCVVHPAAGNYEGTLANALLHHIPALATLPRAGLIHRLDKDTTGLLVVAKSLAAHHSLVKQLSERRVKREYIALVNGIVTAGATIDAPIGRHPRIRTKMAVVASGKEAVTHYRIVNRFKHHTLLSVNLETGRTHQIRVHLAHSHYPIVGDPLYSRSPVLPPESSSTLQDILRHFKRQALHAARLGFVHPVRAEPVEWSCPLPSDMQHLVDVLAAEEKY